MKRTKIEHLSYSMHGYVCKHNVDEKKIVLILLNWSFSRTDMFGSYTWGGGGGGGGGTISTGGARTIWGICLDIVDILLRFRVC